MTEDPFKQWQQGPYRDPQKWKKWVPRDLLASLKEGTAGILDIPGDCKPSRSLEIPNRAQQGPSGSRKGRWQHGLIAGGSTASRSRLLRYSFFTHLRPNTSCYSPSGSQGIIRAPLIHLSSCPYHSLHGLPRDC